VLKRGFILLSLFLLALVVISGCSAESTNTTDPTDQSVTPPAVEQENEVAATTYPLTIKDGRGAELTIPANPKRIVSLIPSLTETLFAIGAGDKVVAVTIYDNYPVNVQDQVEYVFLDGLNPNVEQILNLNADLIVLGGLNDEVTKSIQALGIPTAKYDPTTIEEIYQTIENLGLITNTAKNAQELIASMQEKEQQIIAQAAAIKPEDRVKVWVEVDPSLWTSGKGTFIDSLITIAGGDSIVEEQGYPQYSEEQVIDKNPQVILITYGYYVENAVEGVLAREGWKDVTAVADDRVISVDSDTVTRSGPRIIDGLLEIAKALYPDVFSKF